MDDSTHRRFLHLGVVVHSVTTVFNNAFVNDKKIHTVPSLKVSWVGKLVIELTYSSRFTWDSRTSVKKLTLWNSFLWQSIHIPNHIHTPLTYGVMLQTETAAGASWRNYFNGNVEVILNCGYRLWQWWIERCHVAWRAEGSRNFHLQNDASFTTRMFTKNTVFKVCKHQSFHHSNLLVTGPYETSCLISKRLINETGWKTNKKGQSEWYQPQGLKRVGLSESCIYGRI